MRPALLASLTLLALPAGAEAAEDQVIAEGNVSDVAIVGRLVAWEADGRAYVKPYRVRPLVLRAGGGRVAAGEHQGRVHVVFARCGRSCSLMVVHQRKVRALGIRTRLRDLAVAGGRVFWSDGRVVRSRALSGGAVRREALAGGIEPDAIDADGSTLAVVGDLPDRSDETNTFETGLSVTRPGSGRARLRGTISFSQEYRAQRSPMVTSDGVSTLIEYGPDEPADRIRRHFAGARRDREVSAGRMLIREWDVSGSRAAFLEAPTSIGCGVGATAPDPVDNVFVAAAPCRVVIADLGCCRRGSTWSPAGHVSAACGCAATRSSVAVRFPAWR